VQAGRCGYNGVYGIPVCLGGTALRYASMLPPSAALLPPRRGKDTKACERSELAAVGWGCALVLALRERKSALH